MVSDHPGTSISSSASQLQSKLKNERTRRSMYMPQCAEGDLAFLTT